MHKLFALAAFTVGAAFITPIQASEAIPQSLAQRLDGTAAAYSMTEAKRRRLYMMDQANRQQRYARGGPGYNRGYGPPPRYGYGTGYGYGPRPGYGRGPGYYGPRSGYRPPPRW